MSLSDESLVRWIAKADHQEWTFQQRFDGTPEFVAELRERIRLHHETVNRNVQDIHNHL